MRSFVDHLSYLQRILRILVDVTYLQQHVCSFLHGVECVWNEVREVDTAYTYLNKNCGYKTASSTFILLAVIIHKFSHMNLSFTLIYLIRAKHCT